MERKINPPCEEGLVAGRRVRCNLFSKETGTCPVMDAVLRAPVQGKPADRIQAILAVPILNAAIEYSCPKKK